MLSFLEWLQTQGEFFSEARFESEEWPTSIARMLILRLGGKPEEKIDINALLTTSDGQTIKPAHELLDAFSKAVADAEAAGARQTVVRMTRDSLRKHQEELKDSDDPHKLVKHITYIIWRALKTWDDVQRKKSMEDWEKRKRSPKKPTSEDE